MDGNTCGGNNCQRSFAINMKKYIRIDLADSLTSVLELRFLFHLQCVSVSTERTHGFEGGICCRGVGGILSPQ